ncbi:hypothetical protein LEN26_018537 [Aphanomyces euteiches]|nr:hypothetical protein LEN26_018537 [Aphanomyces euteiches]KAH9128161.1 hypothetical protein AeMF1_001637 [Aphanomyces euteiches]KAH9190250.1 hypothetical protein AeNC1_007773 [Aphanomyces euteiches]
MPRVGLLLCLVVALTTLTCVESRAMFSDALLGKAFQFFLKKDARGNCDKATMKHNANKWLSNCIAGAASASVGLRCANFNGSAAIMAAVGASAAAFNSQLSTYIEMECGKMEKKSSGPTLTRSRSSGSSKDHTAINVPGSPKGSSSAGARPSKMLRTK